MAQFTTSPLIGGETLVEGIDNAGVSGSTILFDPAWTSYQDRLRLASAMEEYDEKVKEFFAPLVEAAEAVKQGDKKDWRHITVSEGSEGSPAEVIHLGHDGILLRILAETDGSSLRWINGTLVALED
jgi:hypothetical protein